MQLNGTPTQAVIGEIENSLDNTSKTELNQKTVLKDGVEKALILYYAKYIKKCHCVIIMRK